MSINSSANKMERLAKKYIAEGSEGVCVHRTLLYRVLNILHHLRPETADLFAPEIKTFMAAAKRPDKKGDYENGMGFHYYCAANPNGKPMQDVNSYYKNGMGKCAKSARMMFEEDYTMALTMHRAGYDRRSAEFLGRAVHMLSDMCCLPHAAAMTYFSSAKDYHKAYELLAEQIYPQCIPHELRIPEIPDIFRSRDSFADDINAIAQDTAAGLEAVERDPIRAITAQLSRTEGILCAFLLRFMEDTNKSDRQAHYITSNSGCRLMRGTAPLTVKVTEKGVTFHGVNPSPESVINVTSRTFYAAHRHDGLFTLSPVKDRTGRVLEVSGNRLIWRKFDPVHGEQLFRL